MPEEEDKVDDTLVWRLEVLGRRNSDPERLGRVEGSDGMLP